MVKIIKENKHKNQEVLLGILTMTISVNTGNESEPKIMSYIYLNFESLFS
jgi:hypothetical protein